jgi:hypothetical protein
MIHYKSTFATLNDALSSSDPQALAVIAVWYRRVQVSSYEKKKN